MSLAFGAIGTGASGSTSVAPSYPSGITVGQLLLCVVTSGATNNETPGTPSDWILLGTSTTTGGAFGVDTGPRRVTVFARIADGSESGTLTVSITNGNTCRGSILRFTSSVGSSYLVRAGLGNDSTAGTGVSIACGSLDWVTGDVAVVCVAQLIDNSTQSSQSLTATGTTFGTRTNRASVADTTGNDHRHVIDTFAAVTTGGGSATTTWAYTASNASTKAAGIVVQLRELGNVAESISFTDAQSLSIVFAPERSNEALTGASAHGSMLARRAALADGVTQTYNRDVADTLTLTAAQTETGTLNSTRGESLAFTDAGAESSTLGRAAAESIGLSATQIGGANLIYSKGRDESIGLTAGQTSAGTFQRGAAEAFSLTASAFQPLERSINQQLAGLPGAAWARWLRAEGPGIKQRDESIGLTDSSTKVLAAGRAAAETIGLTAAQVQRGLNAARPETLSFSDAATETGSIGSAIAEALGLTATQNGANGVIKTRAESIGFSDSLGALRAFNVNASETLGLSATQTKASFTLAPPRFNRLLIGERRESLFQPWAMDEVLAATRAESISFIDSQVETRAVLSARAESIGFSDSQAETATFAPARSETLTLSAAQSASVGTGVLVKQQQEGVTLTAAQSESSSVGSAAAESIGLTSAQSETAAFTKTAGESFGLSDQQSASRTPIFDAQVSEQIALTSSAAAAANHPLYLVHRQEAIAFGAGQSQVPSLNFTRSEVLALNAAAAAASQFGRFMAESLGFSDARYIQSGPLSEFYRYDVPAGSLRYDVPGQSLRYDVPSIGAAINLN